MFPQLVRCVRKLAACSTVLALAGLGAARPGHAQQPSPEPTSPTIQSLLTGYGSVGYFATTEDDFDHGFNGFLSLVPLVQIEGDLLVEGEVEFALHGRETLTTLEHAEIHYLGFERVQLKAGKFHLPFGAWMHTSWVNRMPTPPLLYEDTHGGAASEALLPILFDLGAMAQWNIPLVQGWRTTADVWVSQGPVAGGPGHDHGEGEEEEPAGRPASDAPPLAFGSNYDDNNSDKMVGFRFRASSAGGLTVQTSGFRAAYDDAGELDVSGLNAAVVWAPGAGLTPLFDLRGEIALLEEEYLHHDELERVRATGYYLQLSRRFGPFEPVGRWSHLAEAEAGHGIFIERRRQLALGANYWLSPSAPIKAAYQWEADRADAFVLEWAVGF